MNCEGVQSVLLGFSGGIDSVASVGLLRRQGLSVTALTLDTMGDERMLQVAAAKATELEVEHIIKDVQEDFAHNIIEYFLSDYTKGRTPAPCTMCNPLIKWRHLIAEADRLGIDAVATGHYFNVVKYNNRYYVARALDSRKDQSYYLWGLPQTTLARVITPMGQIIKQDINPVLPTSKESMGLCFLQGITYGDFIRKHLPEAHSAGNIVTLNGEKVGQHEGIAFYTIGQKRGLETDVAGMRVVGINAERNELIVGTEEKLYHQKLEVAGCNLVCEEELLSADDVTVVVRGFGRNPKGYAQRIERIGDRYLITLDDPAWAPAIGQPVVFYRGDRVLGGGILEQYY